MPKFNVTYDRKHTVWHRSTAVIDAETMEEAQKLLVEETEGENHGIDISGHWLVDSCEAMSERENYAMSILDSLVVGTHSELPYISDMEIPSGNEVGDFIKEDNWLIE
jgi:hypothetical protein